MKQVFEMSFINVINSHDECNLLLFLDYLTGIDCGHAFHQFLACHVNAYIRLDVCSLI